MNKLRIKPINATFFTCIFLFAFSSAEIPEGWTKIDSPKIAGRKFDVYFFDYMTRLQKLRPNLMTLKGRAFTDALEDVQFRYPTYVAKTKVDGQDSVVYYMLRPNKAKIKQAFYYDLEVVKVGKNFSLASLEDRSNYQKYILRTVDALRCRGELVCEHNLLVQQNPNKARMIGNGIQITDSIFVRVIPYSEIKGAYYKTIESNQ